MSRTERAARGSLTSALQYGVQIILQLGIAPLVLGLAGQQTLGAYAVFIQLLGYLSLVQLGITVSSSRFLAQAVGYDDNGEQFRRVLQTARCLYIVSSALSAVICYILYDFLIRHVTAASVLSQQLRFCFALIAFWAVVRSFWIVYTPALAATQALARANIASLGGYLLRLVSSILLLMMGYGLWGLVAANVLSEILITFANYYSFRVQRPHLRAQWGKPDLALAPQMLSYGVQGLVMSLSWRLVAGSDNLVASYMLGASAVSVYYSTQLPSTFGYTLVNQVSDNSAPALNELYARKNQSSLRRSYLLLHRYTFVLSSLLFTGVLLLNKLFVVNWLNPQQYGGDMMTVCLAAFALLITFTKVNQTFILVSGRLKVLTAVLVCEGLLNITLSVALCTVLGLGGVMLGTALAHLVTFSYCQQCGMRSFAVSTSEFSRYVLSPVAAPIVVSTTITLSVLQVTSPSSLLGVLLVAGVLVTSHLAVAYRFSLNPLERAWIQEQIRRAFPRRLFAQ